MLCIGYTKNGSLTVFVDDENEPKNRYQVLPYGNSIFEINVVGSNALLINNPILQDRYMPDPSDQEENNGYLNYDIYIYVPEKNVKQLLTDYYSKSKSCLLDHGEVIYVRIHTQKEDQFKVNLPYELEKYYKVLKNGEKELQANFLSVQSKFDMNIQRHLCNQMRFLCSSESIRIEKMRCVAHTPEDIGELIIPIISNKKRKALSALKKNHINPCGDSLFKVAITLPVSGLLFNPQLKCFFYPKLAEHIKKNSSIRCELYFYVEGKNIQNFIDITKAAKKSNNASEILNYASLKFVMVHTGKDPSFDLCEELQSQTDLKIKYFVLSEEQKEAKNGKNLISYYGLSSDSTSCDDSISEKEKNGSQEEEHTCSSAEEYDDGNLYNTLSCEDLLEAVDENIQKSYRRNTISVTKLDKPGNKSLNTIF